MEVCAGVRVWGCVCGQVCKSKSCGQLCCHATLMSRRMRPQNLTAKGFKLKKFNEHAYLIKARTHTHTHTFEECVAERQVEVAHVKQRIHLGTFVVVLAVAPHSVALFSRECNHQSCQDPSLLTSLRLTPVTPPVSTCFHYMAPHQCSNCSWLSLCSDSKLCHQKCYRKSYFICLLPLTSTQYFSIACCDGLGNAEKPKTEKEREKMRERETERVGVTAVPLSGNSIKCRAAWNTLCHPSERVLPQPKAEAKESC